MPRVWVETHGTHLLSFMRRPFGCKITISYLQHWWIHFGVFVYLCTLREMLWETWMGRCLSHPHGSTLLFPRPFPCHFILRFFFFLLFYHSYVLLVLIRVDGNIQNDALMCLCGCASIRAWYSNHNNNNHNQMGGKVFCIAYWVFVWLQ